MIRILKYPLPVLEHFTVSLPAKAEIIRVDDVDGLFYLWAVVDDTLPKVGRKFHAFKTGGEIPQELAPKLKYVGHCALFIQMELMLYIFEEIEEKKYTVSWYPGAQAFPRVGEKQDGDYIPAKNPMPGANLCCESEAVSGGEIPSERKGMITPAVLSRLARGGSI